MKYGIMVLSLALALTVSADTASAQQACGKRADMVKVLADKYGEQPRAMGLDARSILIEIFASKAGTWTILITHPNGASCVMGMGDSWEEMPPVRVSRLTNF